MAGNAPQEAATAGTLHYLTFDPQVKPTDLLTSLSVFCAVGTLIYTWSKDRRLRSKEYGDKVRAAAAITLSKVDRCQILLQSITDLIQPTITEVDMLVSKDKDKIEGRDRLWKRLHEIRLTIMASYQSEQIEVAYAPLLVYRRSAYERFQIAMRAARALEEASFVILQCRLQMEVMTLNEAEAKSAGLGNKLREACSRHEKQLSLQLSEALAGIRTFLKGTLSMSDREILKPDRAAAAPPISGEICSSRYWFERLKAGEPCPLMMSCRCAPAVVDY